jgi:uncharacterized protein YdeI (BOF family)
MKKASVSLFSIASLFLAAALFAAAGQLLPSTAQAASSPQQESASSTVLTRFTGKIVSQNGDRYILRDDANDVWYHLDNQQYAAKYLGKNVAVTGILDGRSDMIHVRNIAEEKS